MNSKLKIYNKQSKNSDSKVFNWSLAYIVDSNYKV